MELVFTNYPQLSALGDALRYGGDEVRGTNYDGRCCGPYGALLGELFLAPSPQDGPGTAAPAPGAAGGERAGVRWRGRTFHSAEALRRHLRLRGAAWESFLRSHPATASALGLPGIRWHGERFYSAQALRRRVRLRGAAWERFLRSHPAVAAALAR